MSAPHTTSDLTDGTPSSQDPLEPCLLSKDTTFHVLQVQRRRLTLQYLQGRIGTISLRDLAEQVAAWENETTVKQLSSAERQRVYIALYQTHLPKLDTEGIIEYNKNRGTIRRTSRADQLDPYLPQTIQQHSSGSSGTQPSEIHALNCRWERYYLGGTIFSASLLVAKVLHLPLVSHLVSQLILPIILLVFSIITAGHYYTSSALPEFDSVFEVTSSFWVRDG